MQERKNRFTEETLCREIVKMYLDTGTIDQVLLDADAELDPDFVVVVDLKFFSDSVSSS